MASYKNTPETGGMPDLVTLLEALGHQPVSSDGDEFHYAAVFGARTSNRLVLQVNRRLGTWFDSSLGTLGKGGGLMDFVRHYWPALSGEQIEEKLRTIADTIPSRPLRPMRRRRATKIPDYRIDRTGPLGYTGEVTEYLMESGLWELADLHMQEVHYFVTDQKGKRKDFCAAGWPNENGGWEVRAEHFSDCIGTRGMTFFPRSETLLAVFPEYRDYLSSRKDTQLHYASILILNHAQFVSAAIKRAGHFDQVLLYMDEIGEEYKDASGAFTAALPHTEIITL